MVEPPQSILNSRGECALPALIAAAKGRCIAAHFGVYDYTASCNITAAYQTMDHPACDFARHVMKVSLAGTGGWSLQGATKLFPGWRHPSPGGKKPSPHQAREKPETLPPTRRPW